MARFKASLRRPDRPEVERLDNERIIVRVDGWECGVEVVAQKTQDGHDGFVIMLTGGSNHAVGSRVLARVLSPNKTQDTSVTVYNQNGEAAVIESPAVV